MPMFSSHYTRRLGRFLRKHLNFYRIHILAFIFVPLIFGSILFACNGKYPISYIDCLFLSVSAMTVCGLATVDLSLLTAVQQAILFFLMNIGSPVFVSWFIVLFRKLYIQKRYQHIIEEHESKGPVDPVGAVEKARIPWRGRLEKLFRKHQLSKDSKQDSDQGENTDQKGSNSRLRPDMIRRLDSAPRLINPSGRVTAQGMPRPSRPPSPEIEIPPILSPISEVPPGGSASGKSTPARRLSDPGEARPALPTTLPMQRFRTLQTRSSPSPERMFNRTATVEFVEQLAPRHRPDLLSVQESQYNYDSNYGDAAPPRVPLGSYTTRDTNRSGIRTKHSGFGGFPMPHEIVHRIFRRHFPKLQQKLTRTVTMPRTMTIASQHGGEPPIEGAKSVPYVSFNTIVGRNSNFVDLQEEEMEEIAVLEYRALSTLLWIIAAYHIGIQLIAFVVIAPYISETHFKTEMYSPPLHRPLAAPWFSLFQVVSAYTNTGMSLVDTSMLPFQTAYPMIVLVIILILAGNTAFPVFLRFTIWILTKLVPKNSNMNETLHFLLDHPRRCFIYLFPSHQTWFLLTVICALSATDWFFFMVLDIGTPTIEAIPLGIRFLSGFMQAAAVRAAGFAIVPLASLAPAVKVLYVFMMYISVYPVAMSVRSTNVYEEQSLGVFADDDSDDEDEFQPSGSRMTVWSKYLAMHARKQLSFDMWWLASALFLLCIIERAHIDNDDRWFGVFEIIFELTSAYGTVGLSLGLPTANYSFCGSFKAFSKFIVICVMIRGRHRGLPVAIDRAVLIPPEFSKPTSDNGGSRINSLPHINSMSENASGTEERGRRPPSDMRQRVQRRFSGSNERGSVARRGLSRPRDRSISFGVQN